MNKGLFLVTGVMLLQGCLEGWGGNYRARIDQQNAQIASLPANFPYNDNQGWFIEENYLLWRPTVEDLDFATQFSFSFTTGNPFVFTVPLTIKKFDYDWDSGVRMGVGRFLPHHDQWDISAYMTYFYADADGKAKTASLGSLSALNSLSLLFPDYDPSLGLADHVAAQWRLNYFVWDLMLGRAFEMTSKIVFHPYIGLRAALIDQEYKARTSITFQVSSAVSLVGKGRISLDNDFWGVGPRIGSNFNFHFTGGWSFLGNLAAALLYGHQHVIQNDTAFLSASSSGVSFSATTRSRAKDHKDVIRTNLEGYIGLGWEHWFKDGMVRVAPALLYEGSVWFNMNKFFEPDTTFSDGHGSLGFMGLTFNLQVDF